MRIQSPNFSHAYNNNNNGYDKLMHLHIKENITLVQDKVSLYYFGGKSYKYLEIN
jgi:hypothetical protein